MINKTKILDLLKKYHVLATKRFGQNFLFDQNVISQIVHAAEINDENVIEIGPGLGSLTQELLKDAKSVTSYEIDLDMINVLKQEIYNDKFLLIQGDFLKQTFNWDDKRVLVANIPYNITSEIIFKLFENNHKFKRAIIMIQKEVGERLLAQVNDYEYSKLTITAQHFTSALKKILIVKPTSFVPSPKVESMVVRLDFNNQNWNDSENIVSFFKLCFSQRRKTLFNNLKKEYDIKKLTSALSYFKKDVRPQEIQYEDFIKIYHYLIS